MTTARRTADVVLAATALSGVVAGTTIDTAIAKLPAWRRLGAQHWAGFTREELPTTLIWYPVLGIGAVLVNIAAASAVHRDHRAAGAAVRSSRAVALLALGHLLTTARAVPHMLRVRETGDPQALQAALTSFGRWHVARTGIDALTFAANLRTLRALSPPSLGTR